MEWNLTETDGYNFIEILNFTPKKTEINLNFQKYSKFFFY